MPIAAFLLRMLLCHLGEGGRTLFLNVLMYHYFLLP